MNEATCPDALAVRGIVVKASSELAKACGSSASPTEREQPVLRATGMPVICSILRGGLSVEVRARFPCPAVLRRLQVEMPGVLEPWICFWTMTRGSEMLRVSIQRQNYSICHKEIRPEGLPLEVELDQSFCTSGPGSLEWPHKHLDVKKDRERF